MHLKIAANATEKVKDTSYREDSVVFFFAQQAKGHKKEVIEAAADVFLTNIVCDFECDYEDFLILVEDMMDRVKYAPNEFFDSAVKAAETSSNDATWPEYKDPALLLLRVCRELQGPSDQFYLTQADAGVVLGKKTSVGRAWMNKFIKDGVISLVKKGCQGRATTYSFKTNTRVLEQ